MSLLEIRLVHLIPIPDNTGNMAMDDWCLKGGGGGFPKITCCQRGGFFQAQLKVLPLKGNAKTVLSYGRGGGGGFPQTTPTFSKP